MSTNIVALMSMSIDIGGVCGFLSGTFSRTAKRAYIWAAIWGVLNSVLYVAFVYSHPPVILPVIFALFWASVGWLLIGRKRAKLRSERAIFQKHHPKEHL